MKTFWHAFYKKAEETNGPIAVWAEESEEADAKAKEPADKLRVESRELSEDVHPEQIHRYSP